MKWCLNFGSNSNDARNRLRGALVHVWTIPIPTPKPTVILTKSHYCSLPRASKFLKFLKASQPDCWKQFMQEVMESKEVEKVVNESESLGPEQLALLVVGAQLTHAQFGFLAHKGQLAGTEAKSRYVLTDGFKRLEAELPSLKFLAQHYPGCCYEPEDYITRVLDMHIESFELADGAPIIVVWKEDGTPEGAVKKYPMLATCVNFPQQQNCQSLENCHVLAIARCAESAESERKHFGVFHRRIMGMAEYKGRKLLHIQVGDGSDMSKKCGHMGQSATHPCFRCFVRKQKAKGVDELQKLSWQADPQVDADYLERVKRERHYERPECARAQKCVCAHKDCAKYLAADIESKFQPDSLLTNSKNKLEHAKRNNYANANCGGQVRAPMGIVTMLDWLSQMYYDVFHADKNHFANCLWAVTVDVMNLIEVAGGAKLSDNLSRELAKTHNLGNLNVKQSETCIEEVRRGGHIRDSHTDLIGAERRELTDRMTDIEFEGHQVRTYAALRPLIEAANDANNNGVCREEAAASFKVLHRLWNSFAAASEIRLSVNKHIGDCSGLHQEHVQAFFDVLEREVVPADPDTPPARAPSTSLTAPPGAR
jgi:hypothetical protein